jgi:hypothetical protein
MSQYRYIFFKMRYFLLTNTQLICTVIHPLFSYVFQICLCSIGRTINASDADISVIFRNSFFCFVYDILV